VRESEPGSGPEPHWLLIGNSRWHWAREVAGQLRYWSAAPDLACLAGRSSFLRGWAAVGPLAGLAWLDPGSRLVLERVPLAQAPPWLGVDRALVGWRAWQLSQGPVLVADAGTALSLTRVDGAGAFAGGRIQAGRGLQLRALAGQIHLLPFPSSSVPPPVDGLTAWPHQTEAAMEVGVRKGLVASVAAAWRETRCEQPDCRLWITGGDGPWLAAALDHPCHPSLALEALAALSPEPGD
jgi:type III pantothenate kinase